MGSIASRQQQRPRSLARTCAISAPSVESARDLAIGTLALLHRDAETLDGMQGSPMDQPKRGKNMG